jgi:hypothetical protein
MKPTNSRSIAAFKGWVTRRANIAEALAKKNNISTGAITKFFKDAKMSQIYSNGLEFAFISPDGQQCHAFAYCKDFLQDAVWATHNKKPIMIWRFSYTPGTNPPLDMNNIRLALRLTEKDNETFKEYCHNSLKFINEVEESMGIEKTTLTYGGVFNSENSGDENNDTWVFTGSKTWMRSSYHISAFSLLLRAGLLYKGGGWEEHADVGQMYGSKDKTFLASAKKGIKSIIADKSNKLFAKEAKNNFPVGATPHTMHNNGIIKYSTNSVDKIFKKYW